MDAQQMPGTQRDGRFLDTIAFGSMLVFASVMPPLGPEEVEVATPDEAAEHDPRGIEERCARDGEWHRCA